VLSYLFNPFFVILHFINIFSLNVTCNFVDSRTYLCTIIYNIEHLGTQNTKNLIRRHFVVGTYYIFITKLLCYSKVRLRHHIFTWRAFVIKNKTNEKKCHIHPLYFCYFVDKNITNVYGFVQSQKMFSNMNRQNVC